MASQPAESVGAAPSSTRCTRAVSLWMARGMAQEETQASREVSRTRQRRGHPEVPPPPSVLMVGEGWARPFRKSMAGSPHTRAGDGRRGARSRGAPWPYVRAIHLEDEQGRSMGVRIPGVLGLRREVLGWLGRSTADGERSLRTSRLFQGAAGASEAGVLPSIGDGSGRSDFGPPSPAFTRSCSGRFWATRAAQDTGNSCWADRPDLDGGGVAKDFALTQTQQC